MLARDVMTTPVRARMLEWVRRAGVDHALLTVVVSKRIYRIAP